jgi:hypothetical protein
MVSYQYTYLLMGVIFAVLWAILFIWRKDTRKEMLLMSGIFGFAGPIADLLYTIDWWNPLTLSGTRIGFEAFFVGFVIGGVSAVIYEDIFKKRVKIRKISKVEDEIKNLNFGLFIGLALVLFFSLFFFGLNSFQSTILSLLIPTLIIWYKRKDLILDSIFTGIILVFVASTVYTILEFLTPGWIQSFWLFENVPNIIILNLPIDDIIWYFLAGMFIGPLYEYWQKAKLINT